MLLGRDVLHIKLKAKHLRSFLVLLVSAGPVMGAPMEGGMDASSTAILNQYLAASASATGVDTQSQRSMELEIDASIPKLKKQGRLHALRNISKVGKVTYRVLGFQGDNTIKNQVIARYLEAEQQVKGDSGLALIPTNYKFKFKGEREANTGLNVYVFQVSPWRKRTGLFKGEVWLDAETHLPVYEKGRLVKNPSVFFKKIEFERAFTVRNGAPVPAHMRSIIETRVVGRVELDVNYSTVDSASSQGAGTSSPSLAVN